jgi:hypothetical protein
MSRFQPLNSSYSPRTRSQARKLFCSDEEALKFMEDHEFNEARVDLLIKIGRKPEAADVLIRMGHILKAHQLLVEDFENKSSMCRVAEYILSNLWRYLSLGFVPKRNKTQQAVAELLHLATSLNRALLDPNDCDEVRHIFSPAVVNNQFVPDIDVPGYHVHGTATSPATWPKVL